MLDIDTAIKHCLEVAEQKEHDSITTTGDHELDIAMKEGCIQCAADHRQLAEWLRELKELKRNPFATIKTACASVMWCIDCKYSGVCPMQDRDCEKPCEWKDMKEGE